MFHRLRFRRNFRTLSLAMAALSWLMLAGFTSCPTTALAQDDVDVAPPAKKKAAPKGESETEEIPEPEDLTLECKDGLELVATYYPGIEGKKTVPIVIIHDFEGNRNEYHPLALTLQAAGHAVIVPDLRGHGDSTTFKTNPNAVNVRELKAKTLKPSDFGMMLHKDGDLQAVRRFLLKKNNEGELNINKLCVIGVGMGATIGLYWTASDWSFPPLAGKKQGQDVHGLVLVSPSTGFRGMKNDKMLNEPAIQKEVSLLILEGLNSKSKKDADRIFNMIAKHRPEPSTKGNPDESDDERAKRLEKESKERGLYMPELKASLVGAKLLNERNLKINEKFIIPFLQWQLVDQDLPWSER